MHPHICHVMKYLKHLQKFTQLELIRNYEQNYQTQGIKLQYRNIYITKQRHVVSPLICSEHPTTKIIIHQMEKESLHNLCYLFWRGMRQMPRFTECIWPHEIHPMYMTLRFLVSICFQNLNDNRIVTSNTMEDYRALQFGF